MPFILTIAKVLAAMSGVLAVGASAGSMLLFCTGGITAKSRFAVVRTLAAVGVAALAMLLVF